MAQSGFAKKHLVQVGPATVGYHEVGEGPAVVFLHGFPLSGYTWRSVVPALADRFACYGFDLVGFGESTSPRRSDFSSQGQAAILAEAISGLGLTTFALVGNDTGGWIARELAFLDPAKVTHLALTNTEIPGHRPPWVPMYQAAVRLPGSNLVMPRLVDSRLFRRSPLGFGGCFYDLDRIDGEFTQAFLDPLINIKERFTGMKNFLTEMKFSRIDMYRQLHAKLTMPTAFLWAESDPTFPVEEARAMLPQFPNVAHFRTLPKTKLFLQEESPDAVSAWLNGFLAT